MKKKKGRIQVTIQREDRLVAITELAEAVKILAKALNCPPRVFVTSNTITNVKDGIGIEIDTAEEVTRTEIKEMED